MKILVTRTDRLGDVMLATPVLKKIVDEKPEAEVTFLVQKAWMPVLQWQHPRVQLMEYDPNESGDSLLKRLKEKAFDVAVVIRDEKKVTQAVKKAGIPTRVGPYSSLHSFVCFNRGRWQRRSKCMMHEAEYNLDLLTSLGLKQMKPATRAEDLPVSWLGTTTHAKAAIDLFRSEHKIDEYVCLHPGSSGSARYISTETLTSLVRGLQAKGHQVVLTGTAAEAGLLNEIAHQTPGSIIFGGNHQKGLDELTELYRAAKVVIAHGTGPLHLAAAAGAPVFAIFPPIFVLSENRWGPLTEKRIVWTPPVNCPAEYKCLGEKCKYYDCMSLFRVADAVTRIEYLMKKAES